MIARAHVHTQRRETVMSGVFQGMCFRLSLSLFPFLPPSLSLARSLARDTHTHTHPPTHTHTQTHTAVSVVYRGMCLRAV